MLEAHSGGNGRAAQLEGRRESSRFDRRSGVCSLQPNASDYITEMKERRTADSSRSEVNVLIVDETGRFVKIREYVVCLFARFTRAEQSAGGGFYRL